MKVGQPWHHSHGNVSIGAPMARSLELEGTESKQRVTGDAAAFFLKTSIAIPVRAVYGSGRRGNRLIDGLPVYRVRFARMTRLRTRRRSVRSLHVESQWFEVDLANYMGSHVRERKRKRGRERLIFFHASNLLNFVSLRSTNVTEESGRKERHCRGRARTKSEPGAGSKSESIFHTVRTSPFT